MRERSEVSAGPHCTLLWDQRQTRRWGGGGGGGRRESGGEGGREGGKVKEE